MHKSARTLYQYIFPAVGGLFMTYLYNVADGIFVGQGVGASALGAVNIGVPFITFVVAFTAMFPMGGATVVAIRMGRGDHNGANHAFMTAFSLTLLTSVILMVIGMTFSEQIVTITGAGNLSSEMQKMSADYLFYYSAFSVPMLMSTCLSVFVRNDGSPVLSFIGMCAGAVSNIFLDWLFIFPLDMGIIGAAIASGLGQIFAVLILLTHFIFKKGYLRITWFSIQVSLIQKICKRGVPEAVSQLNTPVTALCYNLMLAQLIGDIGISTFSILSFIYSLANAILSGVAQGIQPLWGYCYGKCDTGNINVLFRYGILINSMLAVLIYGLLFIFNEPVIRIFNQNVDLIQMASTALPFFSLSFLPMSLNLIYTAFLFSTKRTFQADVIAIGRGIVIKSVAIFCVPVFLGSNAIWLAPFIAEMVAFSLAVILTKTTRLVYT